MNRKKAFTLIELLVVISIIALLLSIILPALRMARLQAQGIVCLANMRSLTLSWTTYAGDNRGRLVPGNVPNNNPRPNYWVAAPQKEDGTFAAPVKESGVINQESILNELRGIRRGLLYPYLETTGIYHCPSDKGMDFGGGYRTYSVTGLMNGESYNDAKFVTKIEQVRSPEMKAVFLANVDPRGWNIGSWVMNHQTPAWTDLLAGWHSNRSTLGFADGHSEMRRWVDQTTIRMINEQRYIWAPRNSDDLTYMRRAYIPGER